VRRGGVRERDGAKGEGFCQPLARRGGEHGV
jgi:hypothetical protein